MPLFWICKVNFFLSFFKICIACYNIMKVTKSSRKVIMVYVGFPDFILSVEWLYLRSENAGTVSWLVYLGHTIIVFLDIIHHGVFYLKQHFRDWILPLSSGKNLGTSSINWVQLSMFLPEDGDLFGLWNFALKNRMMYVKKHNNCINTPSSQTFRSYTWFTLKCCVK
jgi:hypothetical protein